ncbi:MAG: hypothetical protein HY958_02845 [Bacteroidia bacterium]|nr:hypothetical protein [Bacteroidia bacterium]
MRFILLVILLFGYFSIFPQAKTDQKQLQAVRISELIKTDGDLSEPAWQAALVATNFFTYDPTNGDPANEKTEVKVLYDNSALYISAVLYDREPQKILKEFTRRDGTNANADQFWVSINPYADGQNFFQFQVSSVNVQTDIKVSSGGSDYNWNAVWESEVKITDSGWVVEMKIPYSAIRFPNTQEQTWDINFWRLIRRTRETSSWNYVDKQIGNTGAQTGKLTGISNIKAPLRLAFYPYVSAYAQHNSDEKKLGYSFNGGMDVKYGINESFTLDMTLIPDFGQTKSDDIVLNLSPYEIRYNENRQFFTEGTELFNKAGLFYSRRVGAVPSGYSDMDTILQQKGKILDNPAAAKLINATKISGRNKNNLGLGFFNAITDNTYATVEDSLGNKKRLLTEPFTNYNILVADQAFNKNSYINIINTNVYQPSTDKFADVIGTTFRIYEKRNIYAFQGTTAVSVKDDKAMKNPSIGQYYNLNAGKLNGNLYFNGGIGILTDKYNPNDIGYLDRNNCIAYYSTISYRIYQPFWKLLSWSASTGFSYQELYKPKVYSSSNFSIGTDGTFKNYLSVGINFNAEPMGRHDYYEPRVAGRYFAKRRYISSYLWISSDYRKPFALDITVSHFLSETSSIGKNYGYSWSISPRIRVSNHFLCSYSFSPGFDYEDKGWAKTITSDSIVFGKRDVKSITNTFSGSYVFTNKSFLTINIRHYRTWVDYSKFYLLNTEGGLTDYPAYTKNHDINFNAFTIDMVYTWNFAPGSFIYVMWKNNITKSDDVTDNRFDDFFVNFDKTINAPQVNWLSVKLSYYIDYQYFIKRRGAVKSK